ncbi:LysR family transcriptional regulator [Promicromonospora sukumoe]|uniref:LysR family transcriptional regulator n=1 Tax=Promicromonospora sukumoe TaxID=88382 RepID=UPI0036554DED
MELRQLRYFVAVAEERHFGRAARRLHIAAPSLSQQIQALERDLRVTLLTRSPRSVHLTPAGQTLLEHSRVLLARAERARDEVRCATGHHRHLSLRVVSGIEHVLDGPLRNLSGPDTGLRVTTATSTDSEAIHAVREEHIDAAVVWVRATQDHDLAGITLQHAPMYLALPAAHRLAGAKAVQISDLATETIVMFPRDLFLGIWDHIMGHLLPAGPSRLDQVLTQPNLINTPEALLRSVAAGDGVAPVVPATADNVQVPGIVLRPLAPPLFVPIELVWHQPAHPALEGVLALLAPHASPPAS